MKLNKKIIVLGIAILVLSVIYRVSPLRDYGFAPQLAIAIFSGFFFAENKKWAFLLPILSMFLSDLVYEILYFYQITDIQGFYGKGQIINYALFALVTCVGFFIKKLNVIKVTVAALVGPTIFFLTSNFSVWLGNGGLMRPKTSLGLTQCFIDALPFYKNSIIGTLIFSIVLFGSYYLVFSKKNNELYSK